MIFGGSGFAFAGALDVSALHNGDTATFAGIVSQGNIAIGSVTIHYDGGTTALQLTDGGAGFVAFTVGSLGIGSLTAGFGTDGTLYAAGDTLYPPNITSVKTAADTPYAAASGEIVRYDPSGGGFTVTLPSGGKMVEAINVTSSTNPVTFTGTINTATNKVATTAFGALCFYNIGTTNWIIGP